MRRAILSVLLLAALLTPLASSRPQQSQVPAAPQRQPVPPPPPRPDDVPDIRRTVDLVNVVFTVVNRRNKFVTDLLRDNFKILEDDQAQDIRFFNRETDLPLRIGLLLDTSNSIRERLKFEQEAAIDFLNNVVRRKKDKAFLMTFDNEPTIVEEFTDDVGTLTEAINRQRAGGGTALYDAIFVACRERLLNPPAATGDNPEVRRVLVVISDGEDTFPAGKPLSAGIEMAQRAEVAIFAISTSTDWLAISGETPRKIHKTDGDLVLDRLANETGGRAFFPYRIDDLAQSFQDIGDELRSQYSLGYVPSPRVLDGKFHRIRIEVDRKGLLVRARKGYYAPRGSAAPPRAVASPEN